MPDSNQTVWLLLWFAWPIALCGTACLDLHIASETSSAHEHAAALQACGSILHETLMRTPAWWLGRPSTMLSKFVTAPCWLLLAAAALIAQLDAIDLLESLLRCAPLRWRVQCNCNRLSSTVQAAH